MSLEENIRQLRDSLTVTSAQTLRRETLLKDHAEWLRTMAEAEARHLEWLQAHERAIAGHEREMAEWRETARKDREEARERGRVLDERIDKLVSAIGKMIRERNGTA
jgi:hypothetical protein